MIASSRFASVLWTLSFLVGAVSVAPVAWGQDSATWGDVTVVSRPSGAGCRIRGDRVALSGQTPLTLQTSPAGRYEVRVVDPAFERWERTFHHREGKNDTIWMSLQPKTRSRAVLRSLGVPGWGQFYSRRPSAGWAYATGAVVAFGASIAWQVAYVDRQKDLEDAETLAEWEVAARRLDEARDARNLLQGTAAAFWIVSALDAAVFFPRYQRGGLAAAVELEPDPGARSVRLAAKIQF